VPDDSHIDKIIVAQYDNYWQMKNSEVFSPKIIQDLCSHTDITIGKPLKDAITQEALSRIDRMSNETFMVQASLCLQEALKKAGLVVVTVASEGNKRKKIDGESLSRLTECCIT